MWTTHDVPIGGLLHLSDEMRQRGVPPNWMPYVESRDVDETVATATSLGGRIVAGPEDVPGTGRIAVLEDPQGAVFGVYTPANPGGAWDGTPVVGRFSWHELMTTDHTAALAFYRALFGWDRNGEMDMGGGEMYSMYGHGDAMYGGMFNRTPDMANMRPFWLVYIHVKDVGKAVAAATKAGATVHRPQMDIPGGSIAILGDPQGAGFALHHANAQVADGTRAAATTRAAKKVTKAAKKAARRVAKVAKKATRAATRVSKRVAKRVATAAKRGTKVVAKKARRKPAKAATRGKTKGRPARKAARRATPNARAKKKTTTARSRARRR
jgi:predicted enzyme related to lactoylglutathione lyase